ncbi:hypothetical protein V2J09_006629 [Rumex salicifolius]
MTSSNYYQPFLSSNENFKVELVCQFSPCPLHSQGGMNECILDPREPLIIQWNKLFLVACLVSLFIDPLFCYIPIAKDGFCTEASSSLELSLTVIRSLVDTLYIVNMYVRFRTAYVAPSSCVFGKGQIIADPVKIAYMYLSNGFVFDLMASLPLPQVLNWIAIPNIQVEYMFLKHVIRLIILLQFFVRFFLTFRLPSQIIKATGVFMEKAWAGAAFNLMLFVLASHVVGSSWYLFSIERQESCWMRACRLEQPLCEFRYLDCYDKDDLTRAAWMKATNVSTFCDPEEGSYEFGMYAIAVTSGVTSSEFLRRYLYSLWWGMKQLSSLGQNVDTSMYVGETTFAIVIGILGLVIVALLIGNMQVYLQASAKRLEEWRVRRADSEKWMNHRQLPINMKKRVRKHYQYLWNMTYGVEEESILENLPTDLRRDIKRHLLFDLVQQVPLFDQMDEYMLDAICERLKHVWYSQGSSLVSEGELVQEMLFIMRGRLESYTTDGGRSGFLDTCFIGPGDFCGEELLTSALQDPSSNLILPCSTRTVRAITEVEALALTVDDMKMVSSQFRRIRSREIRKTLKESSLQCRTWAACSIQGAWLSHKRRRVSLEIKGRAFYGCMTVPHLVKNFPHKLTRDLHPRALKWVKFYDDIVKKEKSKKRKVVKGKATTKGTKMGNIVGLNLRQVMTCLND